MGTSGNITVYKLLVRDKLTNNHKIVEETYLWSYTFEDPRGWETYLEKKNNYKIIEMTVFIEWDKDLDYHTNNTKFKKERDDRLKASWEKTEKKWKEYIENHDNKPKFKLVVENPDDITILMYGKPLCKISVPEKSCQWGLLNT